MKPKQFSKMTAAEKRVAIAKDAVKQILAEKYIMECGNYVVTKADKINQKSLSKLARNSCFVCQAGAAAISAIRLGNKLNFDSSTLDGDETFFVLKRWFSPSQILLMEAAFEQTDLPPLGGFTNADPDCTKAYEFGDDISLDTQRSLAIFRNIIKNGGAFKP